MSWHLVLLVMNRTVRLPAIAGVVSSALRHHNEIPR